jgi:hypothetical protein
LSASTQRINKGNSRAGSFSAEVCASAGRPVTGQSLDFQSRAADRVTHFTSFSDQS